MTPVICEFTIDSLRRMACSSSSLINFKCVDRPTLITMMSTYKKCHMNGIIIMAKQSINCSIHRGIKFRIPIFLTISAAGSLSCCAFRTNWRYVPMDIGWFTELHLNEKYFSINTDWIINQTELSISADAASSMLSIACHKSIFSSFLMMLIFVILNSWQCLWLEVSNTFWCWKVNRFYQAITFDNSPIRFINTKTKIQFFKITQSHD